MFSTVLKVLLRVYLWLLLFTVGAVLSTAVIQSIDNASKQDEWDALNNRVQFWELVAGEAASAQPTVDNLLARDLQPLLDDPDLIDRFRAPANRYGGITEAIGVDPFHSVGLDCTECGGLSDESRFALDRIAEGDLDAVRASLLTDAPDLGLDLTPFGLSVPTALMLWYLTTGIISAGAAELFLRNVRSEYRAHSLRDLSWEHSSVERNAVAALTPLVATPLIVTRHATRKRFADKVRSSFPEQMKLVDETDKMLERVPADQRPAILAMRNDVMRELEAQTRGWDDSPYELTDLTARLEQANEFLTFRSKALEDS